MSLVFCVAMPTPPGETPLTENSEKADGLGALHFHEQS